MEGLKVQVGVPLIGGQQPGPPPAMQLVAVLAGEIRLLAMAVLAGIASDEYRTLVQGKEHGHGDADLDGELLELAVAKALTFREAVSSAEMSLRKRED